MIFSPSQIYKYFYLYKLFAFELKIYLQVYFLQFQIYIVPALIFFKFLNLDIMQIVRPIISEQ